MVITCLGIIPARGGSKGVPRKNIRIVAGLPLIAYSINAARVSHALTHFVVSTDDEEIADVARSFGAPILIRPPELAEDKTPMLPVVQHAFSILKTEDGKDFDLGIILQPTAPMRTGEYIDRAIQIIQDSGADSVVSVYRVYDHHPARMYRLEDERLVPFAPEPHGSLRQELPPVFHRNGAIYVFRRKLLNEYQTLIGPDTRPYLMPEDRSVNIDNEIDLLIADLLLKRLKSA